MMKKWLLLGVALLAAYIGTRAVKRNAEVIQLVCALIGMTAAAGLAGTPKTRSVEHRLNALIPTVFPNTGGTVTGPVTATGPVGSTGSGTSEFTGGIHSAGVVEADGGVTTTTVTATGAGTSEFTGSIHAAGTIEADTELIVSGQRIAPGQGQPAGYPVVGSPSTAGLGTLCNEIIGGLIAAGIFA